MPTHWNVTSVRICHIGSHPLSHLTFSRDQGNERVTTLTWNKTGSAWPNWRCVNWILKQSQAPTWSPFVSCVFRRAVYREVLAGTEIHPIIEVPPLNSKSTEHLSVRFRHWTQNQLNPSVRFRHWIQNQLNPSDSVTEHKINSTRQIPQLNTKSTE